MISWFKKLWRDKRGNALVMAGAALPLVLGSAGLASDTIEWALWKRQLQRAADSAATAGVYAIVGVKLMNMPEKLSFFWTESCTCTARGSVAQVPDVGAPTVLLYV